MTREEMYKLFLKSWGEKAQIVMCLEEMSELQKELCKYLRFCQYDEHKTLLVKSNIKEEVADVLNMAEQMAILFGKEEIEKIREEKLKRTVERLKSQI